MYQPLTREDFKRVIAGNGLAPRVPPVLEMHRWTMHDPEEEIAPYRPVVAPYPNEFTLVPVSMPDIFSAPKDYPDYVFFRNDEREDLGVTSWKATKRTGADGESKGHDDANAMEWEDILRCLDNPPDVNCPAALPIIPPDEGKYRLGAMMGSIFTNHWMTRGMSNAMTDYYFYPDETHRFLEVLTDTYVQIMVRAIKEAHIDGFWFADDLGTQISSFISPQLFREFYAPCYKKLIDTAHSYGVTVWQHSCGNIKGLIPELIECGLDVLHPIQKYTMDEQEIAREFGDKICLLVGLDVQHIIPNGTPEECRAEVRHIMDTFFRPDGRFMITLGNVICGLNVPVENFAAVYDEVYKYGTEIVQRAL